MQIFGSNAFYLFIFNTACETFQAVNKQLMSVPLINNPPSCAAANGGNDDDDTF